MSKPVTAQETLILAREKIVQGWTYLASARDERGLPLASGDGRAVSWCLWGALAAVHDGDQNNSVFNQAMNRVRAVLPEKYQRGRFPDVDFNDDPQTTKEDVLRVLDRAIANEGPVPRRRW